MQIAQKTRHLKTLAIIMLLVGFLVGGFLIYYNNRSAQAADLKKFNAGNIISDSVFYNYSTMSASQIQDFLNSKVKSCNGDYTCLKDYRSSTVSKPVDSYCSGYNASSSQSAAEIIYGVSQSCKINPQVLLVLLQKETGLVTHTGPGSWRYQTATGMGCPDTAACDSQYYGLFNQLYGAARQFKIYQAKPSNYRYVANRNNSIQWNPSASCGSTNVYIENQATAGLYNYTPYAPNQAALNAGYGTGNGCSSYGNRNFYLYFTDWFGTTAQTKLPDCNSKVPDVSCVWRLYNIYTRAEFLTINTAERDIAVKSGNWIFDGNAFYAYTKQVPGSTPIYRIYMPTQHFFTANSYERNVILSDKNNNDEGIAFYALPSTTVNNASYPVYRLYGNNGHFLNTSTSSFDNTYTREGVGFNAPSGAADAPQPSSGKENVYRLNGPEHFYTASLTERDGLIQSGKWTYEGILIQTTYNNKSTPVYRLNGPEHFYTASTAEKDSLLKSGKWTDEGIAFYVDNKTDQVYRFIKNNGQHFYTSTLYEALVITNTTAKFEGIAFGSSQSSREPVYRLNGPEHLYTTNIYELMLLNNNGWTYEGIAFYATNNTASMTPVYRLNGPEHFYTASTAEKDSLLKSGKWTDEGIAFYVDKSGSPVYRLNKNQHFYTLSNAEKDTAVKSGWQYEGVGWYIQN